MAIKPREVAQNEMRLSTTKRSEGNVKSEGGMQGEKRNGGKKMRETETEVGKR